MSVCFARTSGAGTRFVFVFLAGDEDWDDSE
jgi:hypothetical protein